jgi:CheY-like chemotaxis protein
MLHLLLVEDNPADVFLIREALRTCPIPADVTIAYDGEQALRLLGDSSRKPDLVVLDLNVPRYDGYEILKRYRRGGGAPVVVFTASSEQNERGRAMALGAVDLVVKPVETQAFMKAVQDMVERWGTASVSADTQPVH